MATNKSPRNKKGARVAKQLPILFASYTQRHMEFFLLYSLSILRRRNGASYISLRHICSTLKEALIKETGESSKTMLFGAIENNESLSLVCKEHFFTVIKGIIPADIASAAGLLARKGYVESMPLSKVKNLVCGPVDIVGHQRTHNVFCVTKEGLERLKLYKKQKQLEYY